MSTQPFDAPIFRSQINRDQRSTPPSSLSQRAFADWLHPPISEIAGELPQTFEQEDEAQRRKRQQLILQSLSHPGALYQDPSRLIRRDAGISLTWRLINGPMAGLMIKAVLVAGELQLKLSVSDRLLYCCLLANKPLWLTLLNRGRYRTSIEVLHVVSST